MRLAQAAALLGIAVSELGPFAPRYAESGVGYLLIEVANAEVLAKTAVNTRLLGGMHKGKPLTGIDAFTRNGVGSGNDIRARRFKALTKTLQRAAPPAY